MREHVWFLWHATDDHRLQALERHWLIISHPVGQHLGRRSGSAFGLTCWQDSVSSCCETAGRLSAGCRAEATLISNKLLATWLPCHLGPSTDPLAIWQLVSAKPAGEKEKPARTGTWII